MPYTKTKAMQFYFILWSLNEIYSKNNCLRMKDILFFKVDLFSMYFFKFFIKHKKKYKRTKRVDLTMFISNIYSLKSNHICLLKACLISTISEGTVGELCRFHE